MNFKDKQFCERINQVICSFFTYSSIIILETESKNISLNAIKIYLLTISQEMLELSVVDVFLRYKICSIHLEKPWFKYDNNCYKFFLNIGKILAKLKFRKNAALYHLRFIQMFLLYRSNNNRADVTNECIWGSTDVIHIRQETASIEALRRP